METINFNISIGIKSLNKWNAYLRHTLYDIDGDMISTKASFVDKTSYDMWNDYNGIWFYERAESIESGKYNGISLKNICNEKSEI